MSRRDNQALRCARCQLFSSVCICSIVPRLPTRTRLLLVMHRDEARKPTNTGRLASLALPNSEIVIHGVRDQPTTIGWPAGTQPVLLFPREDARPLAELVDDARPTTLIVPDGTWRQAAKMPARIPALAGVPTASLPDGLTTQYRLRAERRPGGLATMEAIAHAFGILEGAPVKAALLELFQAMVERTMLVRGASTHE